MCQQRKEAPHFISLKSEFQYTMFKQRLNKAWALMDAGRLNEWESSFIAGLIDLHSLVGDEMRVSTKEMNKLGDIASKGN